MGIPKPRNKAIHRSDGVTEIILIHGEVCLINTAKYPIVANTRWYAHKHVTRTGLELKYA